MKPVLNSLISLLSEFRSKSCSQKAGHRFWVRFATIFSELLVDIQTLHVHKVEQR